MAPQFWLHRQANSTEQVYHVGLYAYLDESGHHHDQLGFICLCAWLSDDQGWEKFRDQWTHLRLKYRLTHIHMTQYFSNCRRKGWTDDQAKAVLTEFIDVIRSNVLCGFAVGLDGRYFRAKHDQAGRKGVDPGLFAVERILAGMQKACVNQLGENGLPRIQLHFDEDETYSVQCYRRISRLRKIRPEVKRLVGSITFADDEWFAPLQAADILANLTNRYWRDQLTKGKDAPPSPLLERLLTAPEPNVRIMWPTEYWNAEEIDKNWKDLKRVRY